MVEILSLSARSEVTLIHPSSLSRMNSGTRAPCHGWSRSQNHDDHVWSKSHMTDLAGLESFEDLVEPRQGILVK